MEVLSDVTFLRLLWWKSLLRSRRRHHHLRTWLVWQGSNQAPPVGVGEQVGRNVEGGRQILYQFHHLKR